LTESGKQKKDIRKIKEIRITCAEKEKAEKDADTER
jgi:hypothetical protein